MNLLDLMIKVGVDDQASPGLDRIVGGVKNAASTIGGAVKSAVDVGVKLSGVAAGAFAALGGAALSATGDLEQNFGGLLQVFKENAKKMEAVAKSAYGNMGLSASDFMGTANQIGALLQGSGFGIEESATLAADVMQRAADVSSIMGIDISRSMESITGAAKGNFTMMDNLGVAINDTTIAQYALSKGIEKSTREMTTQEKVGLAMELFMKKSAYAAGNYARENATLAGSFATARAAMSNFLSGAGSASDVISSVTNAAKVAVQNIKDIAPRLAEGIGEIASGLAGELPALFEAVVPAVVSGAKSILDGLLATVRESAGSMLRTISDVFYEFAGIDLAPIIGSLTEVANMIRDTLGGMLDGVDLETVVGTVNRFLETLAGAISGVLAAVQGDTFRGFVDSIKGLFSAVTGSLATNLRPAAEGLRELFDKFRGAAPGVIKSVADSFGEFAKWFESSLAPAVGAVASAIVRLLEPFVEGAAPIISGIVSALAGLFVHANQSEASFMGRLAGGVVKLLGIFTDALGPIIQNVADAFVVFGDALREKAPDLFNFGDGLENVFGFLAGILENVLNIDTEISELILDLADLDTTFEEVFGDIGEVIGSAVYAIADAFDDLVSRVSVGFGDISVLFANSNFGQLMSFVDGTWFENLNEDINSFGEKAYALLSGGVKGYEDARNKDVVSDMADLRSGLPVKNVPVSGSGIGKVTEDTVNAVIQSSKQGGGVTVHTTIEMDKRIVGEGVYDVLDDIRKQKGLE